MRPQVRKVLQELTKQADEEQNRLVSLTDDMSAMREDLDRAGASPALPLPGFIQPS